MKTFLRYKLHYILPLLVVLAAGFCFLVSTYSGKLQVMALDKASPWNQLFDSLPYNATRSQVEENIKKLGLRVARSEATRVDFKTMEERFDVNSIWRDKPGIRELYRREYEKEDNYLLKYEFEGSPSYVLIFHCLVSKEPHHELYIKKRILILNPGSIFGLTLTGSEPMLH